MHLLITNPLFTVLHLLTRAASLMHLALYYCFAARVLFKLKITMECYIMFIFSKLPSFRMPLWLMWGRHGVQSSPSGITRGILHHKIPVWNVSDRFMTMTLENAGLKNHFQHSFQFKQLGYSWVFPLISTNLDYMNYRELGANTWMSKNELSQRPYKTSHCHFMIVSNSIRLDIY